MMISVGKNHQILIIAACRVLIVNTVLIESELTLPYQGAVVRGTYRTIYPVRYGDYSLI